MKARRDILFKEMLTEGWFTESAGDALAPTGYFGWVTNTARELPEIYEAFDDVIDEHGRPLDGDVIGTFFVWIEGDEVWVLRAHNAEAIYRRTHAEYVLLSA